MVNNPPNNAEDAVDAGFIPASGRSLEKQMATGSLPYSCLENPMDRGAWWATVRGVTGSQTRTRAAQTHPSLPAGASSRPQSVLALPVSLSVHALSHCVQRFNASHINNLGGLYMDLTFSIFQV